jgi:tetratricopeptide (TPR) repeat protein
MHRICFLLLSCILFICLANQSLLNAKEDFIEKQGGPHSPTDSELKSLPSACYARLGMKNGKASAEEVKEWKDALGSAFIHIHHYCYALNFLNRIRRGVGDKNTLLGLALGDLQYMQRIPEDHALRPEVEFNIAQVLYQMNRIAETIAPARKAIQLRPNYVEAYLLLSLCYHHMGDRANEIAVLQAGLTKAPDSPALRNALNETIGNRADPK